MSINNIKKKIFLSQRDESDKENQKKIERERESDKNLVRNPLVLISYVTP